MTLQGIAAVPAPFLQRVDLSMGLQIYILGDEAGLDLGARSLK